MFLVGAGPGDPKLLTIRAMEVLADADLILHDRLVSPEILDFIPARATKVDVGKSPNSDQGTTQEEINQIMVREARSGKNVVRLKGGDPLFFSRGYEEMEILSAEGIEFEIVPGISSAIGVPSYAGLPLTHRGHSSSVAIITGYEDPSKRGENIDWKKLASSIDTIVVLMGVRRLDEISKELIDGGLSPLTPIAIIESGTTRHQRINFSTLDDCAKRRLSGLNKAPAIIVIGEVVGIGKRYCTPMIIGSLAKAPSSEAQSDQISVSWCMAAEFS